MKRRTLLAAGGVLPWAQPVPAALLAAPAAGAIKTLTSAWRCAARRCRRKA